MPRGSGFGTDHIHAKERAEARELLTLRPGLGPSQKDRHEGRLEVWGLPRWT